MSKRVVSVVLALVVLVVGVVVVHNHTTNTYDSKVRVIDVVGERVAVVDIYDDVYEFYGTGYTVGEEIVVVLHTNHTADVHDDEIVATR